MSSSERGVQAIAMLAVLALSAPALAQSAGQVACVRIKDRAKAQSSTVTVTAAGVTKSCRVDVPARLACLPAGGDGAFLCYPLRCGRLSSTSATVTDALGGARVVTFKGAQLLCEPATVSASTSSSTTTVPGASTTTTAPDEPCDFDSDNGTCTGTCGGGDHCSAVASGGACECRSTPCGDADSPSCEGYCERDEACVYTLTGCNCVSIP
jgi:hypothetical protein